MDTERLFDENTEEKQDRRAEESLNKLDTYLNASADSKPDYLNHITEDDDVKIEDLRNLINQLKDIYEIPKEENYLSGMPNEENKLSESQGQSESNGKVLTKRLNGFKNTNPETDNTAKEIASSFINCFILCMVTALMGTGWFIYIINHI